MTEDAAVPPALERLAATAGITTAYWDAGGTHRVVPEPTLRTLLAALGVLDGPDASPERIDAALERERLAPWRRALPPVRVVHESEPAAIALVVDERQLDARCRWSIRTEDGATLDGEITPTSLEPQRVDAVAGRRAHRARRARPAASDPAAAGAAARLPLARRHRRARRGRGGDGAPRRRAAHLSRRERLGRDRHRRARLGSRPAALRRALGAQLGHRRLHRPGAGDGADRRARRRRRRRQTRCTPCSRTTRSRRARTAPRAGCS